MLEKLTAEILITSIEKELQTFLDEYILLYQDRKFAI